MNRKFTYLLLFLFFVNTLTNKSYSKDPVYKVADIDPSLLDNAKAVYRNKEITYEVKSLGNAIEKIKYAITILNENGIEYSYFTQFYDKFRSVNNIKATVYDQYGEIVKRIPAGEILDYSAISGFTAYEDTRVKFIDPKIRNYPYTVEYSFEINYKSLFFSPCWLLYEDYNISTEKTSFTIIAPLEYNLRYFRQNLPINPVITKSEELQTYSWDTLNLTAIKYESYSLPFGEYTPILFTAPSQFEIEGYTGNSETWADFGKWILKLNENRNILPEETKSRVQQMISNIDNDYDKVKILYEYMQNKTRYVGIQLGIGGWQPMEASFVDKNSYGDCKALTNYMMSILEIAGIKSYYTLVKAGTKPLSVKKSFPSAQFNHVFLCVPIKSDTIWLECTSQLTPFGYLGDYTDDRDVLLIGDNGGKIVHSKIYVKKDNHQIRTATIKMDNMGNGNTTVKTFYKGLQYENLAPILQSDVADKNKLMYNRINIPNFSLLGFNHKEIKKEIPEVIETIQLDLNKYGTILGERMLVQLNLMSKMTDIPQKNENRLSDIYIRRSFAETDTLNYELPSDYNIYKLPQETNIVSDFGEYKTQIINEETNIKYIRYFSLNKGVYSSVDYTKFIGFLEKIAKEDESKFILMKKDSKL